MNLDLAAWRRLVAGPYAISRWTFLVPVPLLVAVRFFDPVVAASDLQGWYVLATVVGQCAVGLGAWWAWRTVLRPHSRPPRVMVALSVFAALGAFRVATIAAAESVLGLPPSRTLPAELLVGAVQGLVVLTTVSVVVNSRRTYVEVNRRLHETRERIRAVEATDRATAEQLSRSLLDEFTGEVAGRLEALALDQSIAADEASARVRALSSDFVRPMSHQVSQEWNSIVLSAVLATPAAPAPPESRRRRAAATLGEVAATLQPPHPLLVTSLMLALAVPALLRMLGPSVTAAIVVPSTLILLLGSNLVAGLMKRWQGRPAALLSTLTLGSAATAAVTAVWNRFIYAAMTGGVHSFAEPIVVFTFFSVSISLMSTAWHLAGRRQAALLESVEREAAAGEALGMSVSALRRAASHHLHASVQAELVATAMRLQRGAPDDAEVADILLEAAQRVRGGLVDAAGSHPVDDLRAKLGFWSAASQASSTVDPATWQVLAQYPELAERVSRLLSEALTNALKHGTFGPVTVLVTSHADATVEVVVRNPGDLGHHPGDGAGLGVRIMRGLSDELELSAAAGEVVVRAVVSERSPAPATAPAPSPPAA